MRRRAALLFAGALATTCLVAACQAPLPESRVPIAADDPLPAALVNGLRDRSAAIQSIRGVAKLSVDSPELRFRRPQRFAALRPDSLRVETLGLFSQVAAIMVTSGKRYQFFDVSRPEVQEGYVTDDLLAQVAGINLPPRELVSVLLGTPGLAPGTTRRAAERLSDGGTAVWLRTRSGADRELEFDALGRLRAYEQKASYGGSPWGARFADYREVSGMAFAHKVELRFPSEASQVTLQFELVELNPELSPAVFVLELRRAPAG